MSGSRPRCRQSFLAMWLVTKKNLFHFLHYEIKTSFICLNVTYCLLCLVATHSKNLLVFGLQLLLFVSPEFVFFLVLRLLRNHYKKKDPKRQVHYLQFNSSWSLENCHGLHRGGEIVYRVQWFLTRASAEDHYQLTEWAVYDHAQECFVYHVQENGLHLPHVPDGITQFTLISSNLDVYLGN